MLASINLKERISLSIKSHQSYQANSPNVLADLSNNAKANTPIFLDTIFSIVTSQTESPVERFYALYLLLKASETNPGQEFLIKLSFKEELTSYISQTAQYDMDKVLSSNERGKTYFSKTPSAQEASIGVNYVRLCAETIMYLGETYGKSDANNIFYNFWFQNQIVSKRVSLDSKPMFLGTNYQGTDELASRNFSRPASTNKLKDFSQSEQASPAFPIQKTISEEVQARTIFQQGNQETVIKSQSSNKIEVAKDVMIRNLPQVNNGRTDSATFQPAANTQSLNRSEGQGMRPTETQVNKSGLARSNTGGFAKLFENPVDRKPTGSFRNMKIEKEFELKKPASAGLRGGDTPKSPMTYPNMMTFATKEQTLAEKIQHTETPKKEINQNSQQGSPANPLANNPYLQLQFNEKFNTAVHDRVQSMAQVKSNNDPIEIQRLNSDLVNLNKGLDDSRRSYRSQNSQLGQQKSVNIVFSEKGDDEFVDFNDSIFYRDQNSVPQQDLLNVLSQSQGTKGKISFNNSKQQQPQEPQEDDIFQGNVEIGRMAAPVRVNAGVKPEPSSKAAVETHTGAGIGPAVSQKMEVKPAPVQSQPDQNQDLYANVEFYKQNPQVLVSQNEGYKEENRYLMSEIAKYQQEFKRREDKEKFLSKQNHFLKARVAGFDQELSELRKTIGQLAESNQQLHKDLVVQSTYNNSPLKTPGMGDFLYDSPIRNTGSDSARKNIFQPVSYERPSAVLRPNY